MPQETTSQTDKIFLYHRGKQSGPLTSNAAHSILKKIGSDETLFWTSENAEWLPASRLAHLLPSSPQTQTPQHTTQKTSSTTRYRIDHLIGQGGTGAVYIAYDQHLNRKVAYKRLRQDLPLEKDPIASHQTILEEAHRIAELQHPHIIHVFDCGYDSEGTFIVMELLPGTTLDQILLGFDSTPLTLPQIAKLTLQSLDALHHAHSRNLIHLDLKPSNIMLTHFTPTDLHIKLFDFGISKKIGHTQIQTDQNKNDFIIGSPLYVAPERFLRHPIDARTDLYSLGCILYRLTSGTDAFHAETMTAIMDNHIFHHIPPLTDLSPEIPPSFAEWIMWLIERFPENRPNDARAARDKLIRLGIHHLASSH